MVAFQGLGDVEYSFLSGSYHQNYCSNNLFELLMDVEIRVVIWRGTWLANEGLNKVKGCSFSGLTKLLIKYF